MLRIDQNDKVHVQYSTGPQSDSRTGFCALDVSQPEIDPQ